MANIFEQLSVDERESYQQAIDLQKAKTLSMGDLKEKTTDLLFAVIRELVELQSNQDERNTYLKARAKNYLLWLDILTAPEKADKQIKQFEESIKKRVEEGKVSRIAGFFKK